MKISSVDGWVLDRLVEIDQTAPGILTHFLLSSIERRHVIAAYLSVDRPHAEFRCAEQVAWFLREAGHDAILRSAFTVVPAGLRRALSRTISEIQPRRYYPYLRALIARGEPSTVRLIERMPELSLAKLSIIRVLPLDARRIKLVERISSLAVARDVASFISLLTVAGVDRCAMIDALETGTRPMREVARAWALRATFPNHPVAATDDYRPIGCGAELRAIAGEFNNCMRSYIADVLDNIASFAVFTHQGEKAIVHIVQGGSRWKLQGLYGLGNQSVSPGLRVQAEALVRGQGVEVPVRGGPKRKHDAVRRLARYFVFGDETE